jgi:hypothetical protein
MPTDSPAPERAPHPDPEIEALLDFEPVHRHCRRHDGWSPDVQRRFIVALVDIGNSERAAHAVGRTMSGAYKLRTAAGAESFAAAWDEALALYHLRNPKPERIGRPSRGEFIAVKAAAKKPPEGWVDPAKYYLTPQEFGKAILKKCWLKLGQERQARLDGRIVEADFYVRQLTWLEVVIDLGGNAPELLEALKRGDTDVMDIVATPMTILLDAARRAYWAKLDEPERPPLPPLGRHDGDLATGEPMGCQHWPERDGPIQSWQRDSPTQRHAVAAQRAWEEKAKADAEEWRTRVEGTGGSGGKEAQP